MGEGPGNKVASVPKNGAGSRTGLWIFPKNGQESGPQTSALRLKGHALDHRAKARLLST
jgi:hypothetical protein